MNLGGSNGAIWSPLKPYLREFALCYERHPESVRTVPWLRPAGRDSKTQEAREAREARIAFSSRELSGLITLSTSPNITPNR